MVYSLHYYDLVLAVIGASLVLGAGIGYLTALAFELTVPAFGAIAIGFILHALFVNGPVDDVEDLTGEVRLEEVPQVLSPVESQA